MQGARLLRGHLVLHGDVGPEALAVLRREPGLPYPGQAFPQRSEFRGVERVRHAPSHEEQSSRPQTHRLLLPARFLDGGDDLVRSVAGQVVEKREVGL